MKAVKIFLLGTIATTLALLSNGCADTEGHSSNVSLLMPGRAVPPPLQSNNDQGFYQPPENPQFNTARDR
jgi:hypothetical protein